jgi:hypothetical protein
VTRCSSELANDCSTWVPMGLGLVRQAVGLPDGGLLVVLAPVGGVGAPEALAQGQLGQAPRLVRLPGGPVQEAGHSDPLNR